MTMQVGAQITVTAHHLKKTTTLIGTSNIVINKYIMELQSWHYNGYPDPNSDY